MSFNKSSSSKYKDHTGTVYRPGEVFGRINMRTLSTIINFLTGQSTNMFDSGILHQFLPFLPLSIQCLK